MSLDEFVQRLDGPTSLSDAEPYREVCRRAAIDDHAFRTFRHNQHYRRILEHVTYEQGKLYIEEIKRLEPELLDPKWRWLESVGTPLLYNYPEIGTISPTTLRYLKVAAELRQMFGSLDNQHVVEVGGGYGGQARILKMLHPSLKYSIIDLEDVLPLIKRFLGVFRIDAEIGKVGRADTAVELLASEGPEWATAFRIDGDLFLSNYAVTECVPELHRRYLKSVASFMPCGYITGNAQEAATFSILEESFDSDDVLRRLDETPQLVADNFVCVWGDRR